MWRAAFTLGWALLVTSAPAVAGSGVELPPGTLLLAVVTHPLTQAHVAASKLDDDVQWRDLAKSLAAMGFSPEQVDQGRVLVIQEGVYWNNTTSGIRHRMLRLALAPEGLTVEPGSVVEYEIAHPDIVRRVRAANVEAGNCSFDELPTGVTKGVMGVLARTGPSGSATIYCEGIEQEGWIRPRSFWHRLPSAAASQQDGTPSGEGTETKK